MQEQLEKLKPRFDEVDPMQISLNETIHELERLEQDSKNLNRKVSSRFLFKFNLYRILIFFSPTIHSKTVTL